MSWKLATVVVGLGVVAVYRAKRPGVMTKEWDALYRKCISGQVKDTVQLRKIADKFEAARLFPQAVLLRQRAALRELPKAVKEARKASFRKGMESKNKEAVIRLADAFESQGATTAAYRLRQYASGLPDVGASGPLDPGPIVTPPPPQEEPTPESEEPVKGPDTEPAPPMEKPIPLEPLDTASDSMVN